LPAWYEWYLELWIFPLTLICLLFGLVYAIRRVREHYTNKQHVSIWLSLLPQAFIITSVVGLQEMDEFYLSWLWILFVFPLSLNLFIVAILYITCQKIKVILWTLWLLPLLIIPLVAALLFSGLI